MSQIALAFHRISPPFFILRLTFLLLWVLLYQQHHPSQNDEVLKFDHSMKNLHKIGQILMKCLCINDI